MGKTLENWCKTQETFDFSRRTVHNINESRHLWRELLPGSVLRGVWRYIVRPFRMPFVIDKGRGRGYNFIDSQLLRKADCHIIQEGGISR